MASSPYTSLPKLVARISSRDCHSAGICGELQVSPPIAPTDWLALTVAEKSPPCVVQKMVSKKRWRHVASLGVAGAPLASSSAAREGVLPPTATNLWNSAILGGEKALLCIFSVRVNLVVFLVVRLISAIAEA